MAKINHSALSETDLRLHSNDICCDVGIGVKRPEHYVLLRRFVRSFASKGTIREAELLRWISATEAFHMPQKGDDHSKA